MLRWLRGPPVEPGGNSFRRRSSNLTAVTQRRRWELSGFSQRRPDLATQTPAYDNSTTRHDRAKRPRGFLNC